MDSPMPALQSEALLPLPMCEVQKHEPKFSEVEISAVTTQSKIFANKRDDIHHHPEVPRADENNSS